MKRKIEDAILVFMGWILLSSWRVVFRVLYALGIVKGEQVSHEDLEKLKGGT